jgi:hypothetical protein
MSSTTLADTRMPGFDKYSVSQCNMPGDTSIPGLVLAEPRAATEFLFEGSAPVKYNSPVIAILTIKGERCHGRLAAGFIALLMLAPGFSGDAAAATVYKTVGADGVVSYSDTRPVQAGEVETLEIDARSPELTETERERLTAMRETTDRMVADRQQREKHRAELRQAQVREPAQYPAQVYPHNPGSSGAYPYPVYYPYPVRRHGHWGKPSPVHPIARPPFRPVTNPGSPGHDYPASLIRRHYNPQVRAAFEK